MHSSTHHNTEPEGTAVVSLPCESENLSEPAGFHDRTPRILVVEDDRTCRRVLLAKLQGLGCAPDAVDTVHKALAALRNRSYDLVLMDSQMPDASGCEGARWIRSGAFLTGGQTSARGALQRSNAHIPIVAVTADTSEASRRGFLNAGMNACVAKPVSKRRLSAVVATWLKPEGGMSARADGALPVIPPTVDLRRRTTEMRDLDECALLQRVTGDTTLARRIVTGFLSDLEPYLARLTEALEDGHIAESRAALHQLIGGATTSGATRILAHARRMSETLRARNMETVAAQLTELHVACRDFCESAAALLNGRVGAADATVRQGMERHENTGG